MALLIFFELETYVLSDNTLRGRTGQLIHLVRLLCLATISVACWGYFAEFVGLLGTYPITTANCTDIDSSWSLLINLDKFEPLATNPCEGGQWLALTTSELTPSPESYQRAVLLAAVDFINAAAWILVVIVLEIEVRAVLASSRQRFIGPSVINPAKGLLYFILFAAAVYWGFEDDFLDFWDAVLWLFAFFVIERNGSLGAKRPMSIEPQTIERYKRLEAKVIVAKFFPQPPGFEHVFGASMSPTAPEVSPSRYR